LESFKANLITHMHTVPLTPQLTHSLTHSLTPSPPQVSNVKLSKRLASTPAVVVASKWGTSAHMERIMKASVSWGGREGGFSFL